ncbi:tyrosine-type recombinase/integrase [Shimia thalassica]|uniref:tyrosine-type recombinase/integrase n=1 Tax=Shimia thalassica TaxID=1715693 RepID=UPI0026E12F2F|nr:tyrosine-type recombinase/integrase [Shimia thalassica]MDO6522949.1 tyrosine-type recombinase/integrase [Shimia thalassica]
MASAVKAVAKMLNRPPSGVAIDIAAFRVALERGQPGRFGITPKRFSNIRSAFAQALIESGVDLDPLHLTAPLTAEWANLDAMITKRTDRRVLMRFMRWCSCHRVPPKSVTQEVVGQYYDRVITHSIATKADDKFQMLINRWNTYANTVGGWPNVQLAGLDRKKGFQIPYADFPASFQKELQDFYKFLIADDVFQERSLPPQRPVSAQKRVENLKRAASILVHKGVPIERITSLAVLVEFDHAKTILTWYLERTDGKPNRQTQIYATDLRCVARHWVNLGEEEMRAFADLCRRVHFEQTEMTSLNRETLAQFKNPELVMRFINMPKKVFDHNLRVNDPSQIQVFRASAALAIAILQSVPIRIENLCNISLSQNLVRRGTKYVLTFEAHEVKNNKALEYPLPGRVAKMVDRYLDRIWPQIASPNCDVLFPGKRGERRAKAGLGEAISTICERELGIRLTAHQFRHICGFLYLQHRPGDYETVRVLLGHKSIQTTIQFYAGMEMEAAVERFDEVIHQTGRGSRGKGRRL